MRRYPVFILLLLGLGLNLFGQDDDGMPSPPTEEERAERRARFMQMMQERGVAGDVPRNIGQTISTQQDAPEGEELSTTRTPAAGSDVEVNWENITLKDCIEVLCRDLGMEFVISPSVNVSQEVSVRAGDVTQWTQEDKIELFDAILETAGVQRVARGRVWVFAPSDIRPVVEGYSDPQYSDGKPVIGVIRLKSVDASLAADFLNTVGGKPQRVFSIKGSRMILVLGTQVYLTQMEKLVDLIDFSPGVLKPYALEWASSDDVYKELSSLFYGRVGGDGSDIRFISVPRLNTVVAHNVPESMLEELDHWVAMLDRADEENERITKVYRLQVIESETMGKTLDDLYSTLYKQTQTVNKQQSSSSVAKTSAAKNTPAKPSTSNSGTASKSAAPAKTTPTKSAAPGASPDMEEEAIILADKDTNTLIINATPDQHRDIERTIKELDKARRQVLIETVLVEVTLDEGTDLGVEWATSKGISSAGVQSGLGSSISGLADSVTDNGLSYLLKSSDEKWAFIQAAQSDNRLQVLSSPTVLTRDGMEATVSFGDEVPIQEKSTSGTSSTKDSYSYTYQDAKITLTVTPVIDDNRMVTLNLTQSLRQVPADYTIEVTGDDVVLPPIFTTRELSSSLQVDDGQTLILGGLIQRKDQKIKTGIPLLCKTPLIGWLFGRTQTMKVGSEILMILTPHVVDSRDETDLLTRDFRDKIIGAMYEKDIRRLYDLSDSRKQAPAAAEGN
jgi:general secretion pathway protein D